MRTLWVSILQVRRLRFGEFNSAQIKLVSDRAEIWIQIQMTLELIILSPKLLPFLAPKKEKRKA